MGANGHPVMRRLKIPLCGLVMVLTFVPTFRCFSKESREPAPSWEALYTQADSLYQQGKYLTAETIVEEALNAVERQFGPDDLPAAQCLDLQAKISVADRDLVGAGLLYQRALAIRQDVLEADHLQVGSTLLALADIYVRQGRQTAAIPLYRQALAIQEKRIGPDHLLVGKTLAQLAGIHVRQGHLELSEPLKVRSEVILTKASNVASPELAETLIALGDLNVEFGRSVEAELLYQRALIARKESLGPYHPLVADLLMTIGKLMVTQGKSREAELLYQRCLVIRKEALGIDHPLMAETMTKLADLYSAQGEPEKAQRFYARARTIRQQNAVNQGASSDEIERVRRLVGSDEQVRATTLWRPSDLTAMAESLRDRANAYTASGRYIEAEVLFKQSQAVYEKAERLNHPDIAGVLEDYARLLRKLGRITEAESLDARVRRIRAE